MTDLTPGPEMDRAVAEAVGWEVHHKRDWPGMEEEMWAVRPTMEEGMPVGIVSRPSTNIADAIEALEATGRCFWIYKHPQDDFGPYVVDVSGWAKSGRADSLPEAACRAILAWAEAKEKNDG